MLKQLRKIYLPRILSLCLLSNFMVQMPMGLGGIANQHAQASIFNSISGLSAVTKFAWIGAQETAAGKVFRVKTAADSAAGADYYFRLNFEEAMKFRPKNLPFKGYFTSGNKISDSSQEEFLMSVLGVNKKSDPLFQEISNLKNALPSQREIILKRFWEVIKNKTARFPLESMIFFIAQGAFIAQDMIRNYEKNPMGLANLVNGQGNWVSHFAFYNFMLAAGISGESLRMIIRNPRYGFFTNNMPLVVGSLASSITHDIFGEHQDLNKCSNLFTQQDQTDQAILEQQLKDLEQKHPSQDIHQVSSKNANPNKNNDNNKSNPKMEELKKVRQKLQDQEKEILSCDRAYEDFVKSFHSTKKTHEYASTIFSLLTINLVVTPIVQKATSVAAKGALNVLGEVILELGFALGRNNAIGAAMYYPTLAYRTLQKGKGVMHTALFVWADMLLNSFMKNVYYRPLDSVMLSRATDKYNENLKSMKYLPSSKNCNLDNTPQDNPECVHGPLLASIYEYRRQSDEFIDHQLLTFSSIQQQWASLINNYSAKYNASHVAYDYMAKAIKDKFKPRYKDTVSLLDAIDPLNGVNYGSETAEKNIFISKSDADLSRMITIKNALATLQAGKELVKADKKISFIQKTERDQKIIDQIIKYLTVASNANPPDLQSAAKGLQLIQSVIYRTTKVDEESTRQTVIKISNLLGRPMPITIPGQAWYYGIKNSSEVDFEMANVAGNYSKNFGNIQTPDFASSIIGSMLWGPTANSGGVVTKFVKGESVVNGSVMKGIEFNPPKIITGTVYDAVEKGSMALPYLLYTPVVDQNGVTWKNGLDYIRSGDIIPEIKSGYDEFRKWWETAVEPQSEIFWKEQEIQFNTVILELLKLFRKQNTKTTYEKVQTDSIYDRLVLDKNIYIKTLKLIATDFNIPFNGSSSNFVSAEAADKLNLNELEKNINFIFNTVAQISVQSDGTVISKLANTELNDNLERVKQRLEFFQNEFLNQLNASSIYIEGAVSNAKPVSGNLSDSEINDFIAFVKPVSKNETNSNQLNTLKGDSLGVAEQKRKIEKLKTVFAFRTAEFAIKSLGKVYETFSDFILIINSASMKMKDGRATSQRCISVTNQMQSGYLKNDQEYLKRACGQK